MVSYLKLYSVIETEFRRNNRHNCINARIEIDRGHVIQVDAESTRRDEGESVSSHDAAAILGCEPEEVHQKVHEMSGHDIVDTITVEGELLIAPTMGYGSGYIYNVLEMLDE